MNCCDTWGNCNQGRDCPVRTGRGLPHQLAHQVISEAHGCAPEGGNVWFTEPEPPALSVWESVGAYVLVALFAVLNFAIAAGLLGYTLGRWLA